MRKPEGWILGFFEHGQYMGLTESEIQAAMNDTATTVVDGLTTYYRRTTKPPTDKEVFELRMLC